MGRYLPPDVDPRTTTANRLAGKPHALGARASRLASEGILIVRFAMPFPVWCLSCPKPTIIGRGVRFNAEKKQVGVYRAGVLELYEDAGDKEETEKESGERGAEAIEGSTPREGAQDAKEKSTPRQGSSKGRRGDGIPVWSLTLKHAECGGTVVLRTDPASAGYVVVSGARRRDHGVESPSDSLVPNSAQLASDAFKWLSPATAAEREAARQDAFARLEKTIGDREQLTRATERIDSLQADSRRKWEDPYERNSALRREFRKGRKAREAQGRLDDELRDRFSLPEGLVLEAEREEDTTRAKLVEFGRRDGDGQDSDGLGGEKALLQPLRFSTSSSTNKTATKARPGITPAEAATRKQRADLASAVSSSMRRTMDPFLASFRAADGNGKATPSSSMARRIQGVKRKLEDATTAGSSVDGGNGPHSRPDSPVEGRATTLDSVGGPKTALVEYASDDD